MPKIKKMTDEQRDLIATNLHIARIVANKYRFPFVDWEDVYQAAIEGMIQSFSTFDPEKGSFETHCYPRAVRHALAFINKNRSIVTHDANLKYKAKGDEKLKDALDAVNQVLEFDPVRDSREYIVSFDETIDSKKAICEFEKQVSIYAGGKYAEYISSILNGATLSVVANNCGVSNEAIRLACKKCAKMTRNVLIGDIK